MTLVAKAQKTITALQDGYSIVATPSNIVIPSNSDGSSSILTGAKSRVLLQNSQGVNMPVTITNVVGTGCTASYVGNEITITGVSADSGNLAITFSSTGGYVGSVNVPFAKLKQGESTYNVLLSNEVHTIPALFDGRVEQSAIDQARSKIAVLKGATPLTAVASNATPGVGQFRYNIDSAVGGTAGRVDNNTFKLSTISASTCIIKVKVYLESLTRVIEKEMVITKVIGGNPNDFNELKSVFDSWQYAGTNEFDGNKIKSGTITADKIIVENLFARRIQTNNVGRRTTINVLPVESANPTGNTNYYVEDAIRQYHASGRIAMYDGYVTNLIIQVNGVNRTVNGYARVTFKDQEGSPIHYVLDSISSAGLQYTSGYDPVQYYQISGHRLISSSLDQNATDSMLLDRLFTYYGASDEYTPNVFFWCGYYERAFYTLSLGLTADSGSIWQRRSASEGTSFVTQNNGTTPIASGWYYRLGDFMYGEANYYDDHQIVFNLNLQLQYVNNQGKIGATKDLEIRNIRWYQGGTGSNTCNANTLQIQIGNN